MPRLIDSDIRTRDMVVGVNRVLVADGILGLTMRRIAQQSGISTGSLLHHFGSRERILGIAAHRTGRALVDAAQKDSLWVGVDAFLPVDAETRRLTRAWLAWCELWRSETWLADTVADLRRRERAALAAVLEHPVSTDDLDLLVALLDGLRAAVCAPLSAMTVEQATASLRTTATALAARSG